MQGQLYKAQSYLCPLTGRDSNYEKAATSRNRLSFTKLQMMDKWCRDGERRGEGGEWGGGGWSYLLSVIYNLHTWAFNVEAGLQRWVGMLQFWEVPSEYYYVVTTLLLSLFLLLMPLIALNVAVQSARFRERERKRGSVKGIHECFSMCVFVCAWDVGSEGQWRSGLIQPRSCCLYYSRKSTWRTRPPHTSLLPQFP